MAAARVIAQRSRHDRSVNPPYDGAPMILANIPSPSRGVIEIGPFELHAYGLMLALGVLAAAKIAERRWTAWGHPGREIGEIVIPVVIAGVIGARVYHLFTGYDWDDDGLAGTVQDLGGRPVDLGRGRRRR